MIRSCKDKRSEALFRGEFVKGVVGKIQQRAREQLKYFYAAATLGDLRVPPGNQLEALKGDRKRQYSIRVNGACVFVGTRVMPSRSKRRLPLMRY